MQEIMPEASGVAFIEPGTTAVAVVEPRISVASLKRSDIDRAVWRHSRDLVFLLDAKGRILFTNPATEKSTGHNESALHGRELVGLAHRDDQTDLYAALAMLADQNTTQAWQFRIATADGGWRRLEALGVNLLHEPGIEALLIQARDITTGLDRENDDREELTLYQTLLENMNGGVLAETADRRIFAVNSELCRIFSINKSPDELHGTDCSGNGPMHKHVVSEPRQFTRRTSDLAQQRERTTGEEIKFVRGDVYERDYAPLHSPDGRFLGHLWQYRDITERKRTEARLEHHAFYDPLTGLANRTLFLDRLGRALSRAKRHTDFKFALLFLDLDRFKVINDSLGHALGDQLLIEVARRLERCVRDEDTVARLGGDEFTIILDGIDETSDATRVADRILEEVSQPIALIGHDVYTAASIGIAVSTSGYQQADELLRDADTAMYRAKNLGRSRCEIFDVEMHNLAREQLQLETELRRAVDANELSLHYQPIVSLETGGLLGFEALVRWFHPERGAIPPMQFIPVAEETGLIVPLGLWVLREACAQMRAWHTMFADQDPLAISVNLSVRQFARPDFIDETGRILAETGLDPRSLKMEITESVLMENFESAKSKLEQLKALQIQLYMDDFGTGYSSLSYLRRFPIDILKIDRSFIETMHDERRDWDMVEGIVTLAHKLGIKVTAEGLANVEQRNLLCDLHCEYGQGYYFSAPLDTAAAEALITSRPRW